MKEAEGKPLWSGELYKGLGVLVSLGQAARAASSPWSCLGLFREFRAHVGTHSKLWQVGEGRGGDASLSGVEDSHVSLKNVFSPGHCYGNVNKDFSNAERRDLCGVILGRAALASQLDRRRFPLNGEIWALDHLSL